MNYRRLRALTFTVGVTAVAILLSGCPNTLAGQIAEDVLVERAGGRPEIVSQVPEAGATGVLSNTQIEVEFNMPLADDATEYLQVTVGETDPQAVGGTVTINEDTNSLLFQPSAPLDVETRYNVAVASGLKNEGGVTIADEQAWGFDTTLVNPGQFRFDIDMSDMDLDLSTYRTYLSVDPESSVSDSPFGGTIYGGEFGSNQSFVIDAEELGAASDERVVAAVMILASEIVEDSTSDFGITFDDTKDWLVWYGYQGSTGEVFPSQAQLSGVTVSYGQGGYPHGIVKSDPGFDQLAGMEDDTTREDFFFERGTVHNLSPEDAYFRLDYQEIQNLAQPLGLDSWQRSEVADRYGLTAFTFTSGLAGNYSFGYQRDSTDNRDTYSQLRLFERSGSAYSIVQVNGDPAVSRDYVPSFNPYDRGEQFGTAREWEVDSNSDSNNDTVISLAASTEYLLIVDSWLHLPATGGSQIDSGAFRLFVGSTP